MKMKVVPIVLIFLAIHGMGFSQMNKVDSPVKNFEKLWKEFEDRYANFELKGVDWLKVYKKYNTGINHKTTNKELFEICCSMVHELNDGHVTIDPNFEEEAIECGPPYDFSLELAFNSENGMRQLETVMEIELKRNGFYAPIKVELSEGTNFQYRVSDSYGYLRLDEMTEKNTFGKFRRTADRAIKAFLDKKGLIIDLRFNGGGWDDNAYTLARRFVPKGKKIGHYERQRIKGTTTYTPLRLRTVNSGGQNQFTGPIVILTSDFTASAAEVFVLLMRELPNVTLIGDHTEGIFSDMYEFDLPNKWEVTLSHQQYFSTTKENFEGTGIPPDIMTLNSRADIANQTDPVLQKAIQQLEIETKR